jgi:beta-lactamase regulating signal transducer with metallopeptidase domain
MHLLIIYLIKAAIFQLLLLACYWLLLRRDTFYKMNRYYFVGGLLLSLIVPLINFDINSWFRHKEAVEPVFVYQYIPNLSFEKLEPWWQQFSFGDYALMLFVTGSILMLFRLLLQYLSLKKLETKQKANFEEYNIQLLDEAVNPFSFGRTIYLNPQLHSEQELEEIIEHELVHVIQKHSIDIIAASVNRCIFWWNPAAWVLNKVIRDNLEFIADKTILEKGFDRKHYQYHLLRISQLAYPNTIAQHFNFSNLKKRIAMMNKKETSRYQKMKWLLLVPVAAVLLLSFNYRENIQQQIKIISGVTTTDTIPPLPRTPYPVKPNSKGNYVDIRNYNGECIVVVESNKQQPIARIPLTKWDADQKNYVAKYGEIPPLPKPVPPVAPKSAKAREHHNHRHLHYPMTLQQSIFAMKKTLVRIKTPIPISLL